MKSNEVKELRTKTKEELVKILTGLKSDIVKISIQMKMKQMKDVSLLGKKRKDAARILTFLRERELVKS